MPASDALSSPESPPSHLSCRRRDLGRTGMPGARTPHGCRPARRRSSRPSSPESRGRSPPRRTRPGVLPARRRTPVGPDRHRRRGTRDARRLGQDAAPRRQEHPGPAAASTRRPAVRAGRGGLARFPRSGAGRAGGVRRAPDRGRAVRRRHVGGGRRRPPTRHARRGPTSPSTSHPRRRCSTLMRRLSWRRSAPG